MSPAKCSSQTLRFSFSVGVISSSSAVKSRGQDREAAAPAVAWSGPRSRRRPPPGRAPAPRSLVATASTGRCRSRCSAAHAATSGSSSVISAAMYGRRSPTTIACEMNRDALSVVLEVLRRHVLPAGGDEDVLLAVGDLHEAVLVDRRHVARVQPAVVAEDRARRLLVLEVAGEDRRARDEQLAVLGEPQLDAAASPARRCRSGTGRGG